MSSVLVRVGFALMLWGGGGGLMPNDQRGFVAQTMYPTLRESIASALYGLGFVVAFSLFRTYGEERE